MKYSHRKPGKVRINWTKCLKTVLLQSITQAGMVSLDVGVFILNFSIFLCKSPIGLCRDQNSAVLSTSMKSVNISISVPLSFIVSCVNFYLQLLPSHYQICSTYSLFFFVDDFHFPEILILFPVKWQFLMFVLHFFLLSFEPGGLQQLKFIDVSKISQNFMKRGS